jgi:hypothetical protein
MWRQALALDIEATLSHNILHRSESCMSDAVEVLRRAFHAYVFHRRSQMEDVLKHRGLFFKREKQVKFIARFIVHSVAQFKLIDSRQFLLH